MKPSDLILTLVLILLLSTVNYGADSTIVIGGNVSGLWTAGDSPYLIYGNITIPVDSTLNIEPGVTVEFQGHYALEVQGRLLAVGTENDTIHFTVNDTTGFSNPDTSLGGWYGIRFTDPPQHNDSSKIVFCKLQYGKAFGPVWHLNAGGSICIIQFHKVLISNCLITNNSAVSPTEHLPIGGGLYFFKSDVIIKNNTFSQNHANGGGAVFFDESSPVFSNNIFLNNYAHDGGAVSVGGTSFPSFNDDIFKENRAANNGGGILLNNPSEVTLNNVTLTGDTARWGGGVGLLGGTLNLNNCLITENSVSNLGGGVASDYGVVKVVNSIFSKNKSDWSGAIHLWHTDLHVSNSRFEENTALNLSGAIHADFSQVRVSDCSFKRNNANLSGAVHAWYADLQIKNCLFEENTSVTSGGGIHGDYSEIEIDSCIFFKNVADWGAGIQVYNCDLQIDSCSFKHNSAVNGRGGAIDFSADSTIFGRPYILTVNRSLLNENSTSGSSGALYIEQINENFSIIDLIINRCEFRKNQADIFGALRIAGTIEDFTVSNCLFTGNTSKRWVGCTGIITGGQGKVFNSIFALNYSSFSDSTASYHGISLAGGSEVEFFNCTIFDSTDANGIGISVRNGSKAIITNSILWDCGDRAVYINTASGDGCVVDVNYCDIQNGLDSVFVSDSVSTLNWGVGNIDADPLFVDASNLDFHLQNASPCIGTGVNRIVIDDQGYYSPIQDIEGNPRPNPEGSYTDMGAYEHALGAPVDLETELEQGPKEFKLSQNYPNPFNNSTIINYQLAEASQVELSIYNILGQKLVTLVFAKQPAGTYEVEWDATDFASGLYLYKLSSDQGFTKSKKLLLLK